MQKWIKDIFSILCLMYCLNAWIKTINIGNGYDRLRYIILKIVIKHHVLKNIHRNCH